MMWFIIFITFMLLSRIADEVTVISFIGFVGNLIGAACFKLARARRDDGRT
jgi:nicotinamide riboside transporter PnuC